MCTWGFYGSEDWSWRRRRRLILKGLCLCFRNEGAYTCPDNDLLYSLGLENPAALHWCIGWGSTSPILSWDWLWDLSKEIVVIEWEWMTRRNGKDHHCSHVWQAVTRESRWLRLERWRSKEWWLAGWVPRKINRFTLVDDLTFRRTKRLASLWDRTRYKDYTELLIVEGFLVVPSFPHGLLEAALVLQSIVLNQPPSLPGWLESDGCGPPSFECWGRKHHWAIF